MPLHDLPLLRQGRPFPQLHSHSREGSRTSMEKLVISDVWCQESREPGARFFRRHSWKCFLSVPIPYNEIFHKSKNDLPIKIHARRAWFLLLPLTDGDMTATESGVAGGPHHRHIFEPVTLTLPIVKFIFYDRPTGAIRPKQTTC